MAACLGESPCGIDLAPFSSVNLFELNWAEARKYKILTSRQILLKVFTVQIAIWSASTP